MRLQIQGKSIQHHEKAAKVGFDYLIKIRLGIIA
jgi:hypothetical protein